MSAPAGWQRGSWRGLPFVSLAHDLAGGRRLVVHEMPQRDLPVIEDLGRAARRFSLECQIRGAGYLARANAFDDALQQAGPGTLIHPWKGAMQLAVETFTRRDSVEEGGLASFTIEFIESGLPARPGARMDSRVAAVQLAGSSTTGAAGDFASSFSVAGAPAFVTEAGGDLVTAIARQAAEQASLGSASGAALRRYALASAALSGAQQLVRDPAALSASVIELIDAVFTLSPAGTRQIAAMSAFAGWTVAGWGAVLNPVVGATPARQRQARNQEAMAQLVNATGAAGMARAIAATRFESRAAALRLRDETSALLDALALRQADAGDDDGAARFDRLREAIVRDITARAPAAIDTIDHRPAETVPALLLAWQLYGDARRLELQTASIIARNSIVHPGFVPGGLPIQVAANG